MKKKLIVAVMALVMIWIVGCQKPEEPKPIKL
jgi:uncharacterized lipoprotein NlpE involved in copper resistance